MTHGKLLTKYYIGQLKKVHYLNISRTFFFTNIGKDLANKIKDDNNTNYSYYLTGNSENRFQFQEINEESILNIIDNCPAKSSRLRRYYIKTIEIFKICSYKPSNYTYKSNIKHWAISR